MLKKVTLCSVFYIATVCTVNAAETSVRGIVDIRASHADSIESYVHAGYGKFSSNNGGNLSLGQLGVELNAQWDSGVSGHVVLNAYADENESEVGFTEAFIKYKGLPNANGYRWQSKAGIFYPAISLENDAIAWASKDTLTSSAINTWIGEEMRMLGGELKLTRLGRYNNASYDLSFTANAFVHNDPIGALISWHGWTISQRQSLWTEKRKLPDFEARRPGNSLASQASSSDPFVEIDDRIGFHVKTDVKFHRKGLISLGYYDNNAEPYKVKSGQYAWKTRFYHAGVKFSLPLGVQLTSQYLKGDTLMQNPDRVDMVNNDYSSGFMMLSKRVESHRMALRLEEFSVTDNDTAVGDDNNEYGKSATINYTNRLAKQWFVSGEYIWINSERQARSYINEPINLVETQVQLAVRYFF